MSDTTTTTDTTTDALTILGQSVRTPVEHLETFDAPAHVTTVTFVCDEVTSLCPVTAQPDMETVTIQYEPDKRCIESKSLKLYLWGFRERGVFAEQFASDIAARVMRDARPYWCEVTVKQKARGGIELSATAVRSRHRDTPDVDEHSDR